MTDDDRILGMHCAIERRDVLKGLGVAGLSLTMPGAAFADNALLRRWGGNPANVFTVAHDLRDGLFEDRLATAGADEDVFDVVVVGAGLSGLAAAAVLSREGGGALDILVLENHAEPGGAAKPDLFQIEGRTLYAAQGSVVYQNPTPGLAPPRDALALIHELMPELDTFQVPHLDRGFSVVMPDAAGPGLALHKSVIDAPLPDAVKAGYFTFLGQAGSLYDRPDWRQVLIDADQITFREYLKNDTVYRWMVPELATFFCLPDQVSAAAVLRQYGGGPPVVYHIPSGNAAFATAFMNRLKDRDRLHIRCSATVLSLENRGNGVDVIYIADGRLHRIRARAAIMAGGAFVARHVVRDLPPERRAALQRFIHAPVVWINVVLSNAHAVDAADPGFLTMLHGTRASLMATYDKATGAGWSSGRDPSRPTVIGLSLPFFTEGVPAIAQAAAARQQILETPFATYERWVRQDLQAVLGPYGFHAARDIAAISVCRWGHGYVYPDPGFLSDGAREIAAAPFGRIAFANTDLDGFSHLPGAVGHGLRAAREILDLL